MKIQYFSPYVILVIKSRKIRWALHVARMVETRGSCRDLVGKRYGKRPLGKTRRIWDSDIKMTLEEMV
jgi:hypothetical protein